MNRGKLINEQFTTTCTYYLTRKTKVTNFAIPASPAVILILSNLSLSLHRQYLIHLQRKPLFLVFIVFCNHAHWRLAQTMAASPDSVGSGSAVASSVAAEDLPTVPVTLTHRKWDYALAGAAAGVILMCFLLITLSAFIAVHRIFVCF